MRLRGSAEKALGHDALRGGRRGRPGASRVVAGALIALLVSVVAEVAEGGGTLVSDTLSLQQQPLEDRALLPPKSGERVARIHRNQAVPMAELLLVSLDTNFTSGKHCRIFKVKIVSCSDGRRRRANS